MVEEENFLGIFYFIVCCRKNESIVQLTSNRSVVHLGINIKR